MKNKYSFTLRAAVLLLLMFPFATKAQDNNTSNITKPIYNYQFKVGLTAAMYDKIHLDNIGAELLKTSYFPSYDVSLCFSKHIHRNYFLNSSLSLTLAPIKFHFFSIAPENSIYQQLPPVYEGHYVELSNLIFIQSIESFSISGQKIFYTKHINNFNSIETGLRINRLVAYPYEITTELIQEVDSLNDAGIFRYNQFEFGSQYKLSTFIKVGRIVKTKKNNFLHYNFVIHYCPSPIGYGWYKFYNLGLESFGTLWQHMNYLGFEFCYGF